MTDDRVVQAGWYPDPLERAPLRWWDGRAWTVHVTALTQEPQWRHAPAPGRASRADREPLPGTERVAVLEREPEDLLAPPPPAEPVGEHGWAGAAMTLHWVQSSGVPVVVRIVVDGLPLLTIDTRLQAYDWSVGLDRFPERPESVHVAVDLLDSSDGPAINPPGQPLDALLWRIGAAAFPGGPAPWFGADDEHRLARWPDLTSAAPNMVQIRQAALLVDEAMTLEELASVSVRPRDATTALLNALSLTGSLRSTPRRAAPPARGRFRRRRARG